MNVEQQLPPIEASPPRPSDEREDGRRADLAGHRAAFEDALRGAELTESDRAAIDRLAAVDTPAVAAIVSLLFRAWQGGYDQAVAASENPRE